jgi:sulfur relay (sulfurtransferase) DsrC/TusE family protein
MDALTVADRSYPLDRRGFLSDPGCWDLQFAAAVARELGQPGELTLLQLKVVLFVRRHFVRTGEVARVFETGRACGLSLGGLRRLFPWGYQRGVCRLAGISYDAIDSGHHALTFETIADWIVAAGERPRQQLKRATVVLAPDSISAQF